MSKNLINDFGVIFGMKRLSLVAVLGAIMLLATSPFLTNDAFAHHLSDEMIWQVVVITSKPACSNSDYQMMNKFDEITEKYLDLYQLENDKYDPACFPDSKYLSEYTSPQDLDLIVLVYDNDLGEKELHSQDKGGVYSHTGVDRKMNHAIIICGDCPTWNFSNPEWILSHELSHFVLYYFDFDLTVIEDAVHSYDEAYDECLETKNTSCIKDVTKIKTESYAYSVMPIYEPAIEKTTGNELIVDDVNPVVMELTKQITEWWAEGKITDGDYANAVGFVIDKDVISSHGDIEILFADDPIDESVTWDELLEDTTTPYWDRAETSEDETAQLLSRVPQNLKTQEEIIYADELISGLPEWFKTTAGWWAEDKITNEEMMKSVEYLRDAGVLRPR